MGIVAVTVSVIFFILGILHLYWASGGRAGISKAIPLIEGKPAIAPGKAVTLLVAVGLMGIAGVSYALGQINLASYSFGSYIIYAGWFLAFVFLARAVGDFRLVGFFKKHKGSEFAAYDTKYYSPFCISISLAFSLLSISQT